VTKQCHVSDGPLLPLLEPVLTRFAPETGTFEAFIIGEMIPARRRNCLRATFLLKCDNLEELP
jgi:hypothetical protein